MWSGRGTLALLLALAACAFTYRLGATPLLDDPNEGEYAEVAREMVETGNWISPQLNYSLFLSKPPLTSWMIGVVDLALGISEFSARLPSAVAACAIVGLIAWLGGLLFDAGTGLLAGFILVTMGGFFAQSHEAQPDLIFAAGIVGSLIAWTCLLRAAPTETRGPLIGLQVSLAVSLLAEGMLALVIPGVVFAAQVITERRADVALRLLHPRAWWLFFLLILPWHIAIAVRHPGFFCDYVVDQQLLFFLGRTFSRGLTAASFTVLWTASALRLFPWTIFVPLAAGAAIWRTVRNSDAAGDRLVLTWAAAALFLSSILALPAVLLLAKLFRDYAHNVDRGPRRLVSAHTVVFAALALTGALLAPGVIARQMWLTPLHELPALTRWLCAGFAVGGSLAAFATLVGRRTWLVPVMTITFVLTIPEFQYAMSLLARVNSSAPIAAVVRANADLNDRLVYEAPVEYQSCAGFNFYLRRKLDLLRPPDFVVPHYLQPYANNLFINRVELERAWRVERVFFITDPSQNRTHIEGAVPQPFYIVAHDTTRWVVTNEPLH